MEWTTDWRLRAWMALLGVLIAVVTTATVVVELLLFFATYAWIALLFLMCLVLVAVVVIVALLLLGVQPEEGGTFPTFSLVFFLTVLGFVGYFVGVVRRTFTATDPADLVDAPVEEADPELLARVARLAAHAGLPAPEVLLARTDDPVVLSAGFRPGTSAIVVSDGVLDALDDDELAAVLAHELAHVGNRDAALLTASSLPRRLAEQSKSVQPPLLPTVIELLGGTLAAALGRKREFVADDGAVAITGNPAALACALETLDRSVADAPTTDLRESLDVTALSIVPIERDRDGSGPLSRLFGPLKRRLYRTHPATERRIERLRRRVR